LRKSGEPGQPAGLD